MEYKKSINSVRAMEAMVKDLSKKMKRQRYEEANDTRGAHMEENKRFRT